MVVHLRSN